MKKQNFIADQRSKRHISAWIPAVIDEWLRSKSIDNMPSYSSVLVQALYQAMQREKGKK